MKKYLFLTIILTFTVQLSAQNYDFPSNPKPGKCYVKLFNYDKKFKWKIVDCNTLKRQSKEKTTAELLEFEREKIKMKKYQEKLKNLGYKVDITGVVDNKTIIAHHKYLKKRRKAERKKRRAQKRAKI